MIKAKKGLERNEQRKNNILKNLHKIYQTSKKIWLKNIINIYLLNFKTKTRIFIFPWRIL